MKKPIEVGMKVEWVSGNLTYAGRVSSALTQRSGDIFYIDGSKYGLSPVAVHRRQITKVWRKKPKPVAREIWANEYETVDGKLVFGELVHDNANIACWTATPGVRGDRRHVRAVRFREVLE